MKIICLCSKARTSDSCFDDNPYWAFIEPAWAGNHISEAILLITDIELEYYQIPVFDNYNEASNFAHQQEFGVDVYDVESNARE